jgi:hypothetical protein
MRATRGWRAHGRRGALLASALVLGVVSVVLVVPAVRAPAAPLVTPAGRCSAGAVHAVVDGKGACLKAGQRCTQRFDGSTTATGFHCHTGRLARSRAGRTVTLKQTGPPELVFDWTTSRCEDYDLPDVPARAFRDADGQVQLLASNDTNRRSVGPDFDHLVHDCTPAMPPAQSADPATRS